VVYRASLDELHVRRSLRALARLLMLSGMLGCAAGTAPPTMSQVCVPGDQKACACPGLPDGVQVCADDGSRYGACTGCVTAAGGHTGTTGAGGAITGGGSGGALGTGGSGAGGSTDGAALPDAGDAAMATDAPAGTDGAGATDAGGSAGAPGADGAVVDGGGTADGGVDVPSDAGIVGVTITPGATGLVVGSSNSLGVQGPWYAFGDGVGASGTTATGSCERAGHLPAECSMILTPAIGSFPNTGGRMCTSGTVAVVIVGMNAMFDYGNITGAGIGLDLNNSTVPVPVRGVFNAVAKGVTGVAFDLEIVTLPGLRVEFPTPATDGTSAGAAYWGGNAAFGNSHVVAGTNVLRWADVQIAGPVPTAFDPTKIESILFHVPTNVTSTGPYSFCVSNLRLLTN
jgi:hypothetical protein